MKEMDKEFELLLERRKDCNFRDIEIEEKIKAFLKDLIPLVIRKRGQNHRLNGKLLSGELTQEYLLHCLENLKDLDLVMFDLLAILKRKYESDEEIWKWKRKLKYPKLKKDD